MAIIRIEILTLAIVLEVRRGGEMRRFQVKDLCVTAQDAAPDL